MSLEATLHATRGTFELDARFAVTEGRTLAVLGPNGAGKSTLLAALAGVIEASGSVSLNGRELAGVPTERRRIGYVFQDFLLFPHLTVLENVAFGPRSLGMPRAAARDLAEEWLARLGIAELAPRRATQLSGGQAQRVALARAVAAGPDLLLLDEPLAALDVEVRAEVREELARHIRDWGGLTILVTHSFDDVTALADDVLVLERGRVTQRGSLREVIRSPATSYARRLVAGWAED